MTVRPLLAALLLATLLLPGCVAVRPWEREHLARSDMRWDPDPLDASLRQHIQFSKEGALDGAGAGGGGCGCN